MYTMIEHQEYEEADSKLMNKSAIFAKIEADPKNHELWIELRSELKRWARVNNIGPAPLSTLFHKFHSIHISTHCKKSHK